ncbi:UDP-N-acetylmuramoyl-tripeptide--D-alanyl-D-alanine ligase [uncultured Ligilactobacillus sp.]|uniref:UDP-N-acetylmuramoyl-tripeptide--D-alanyl-D- alanine ligase n=1 Tax=uncultured Ligilactobacillus sp. TaxID=2837633 RepID=UPI00272B785E|nr:UDP-N-acetylmuramoyl-tripeptide--D-alanyl-D-alanine ligase [uncultured Ligilactobacillus sp.]
MKMQLSEIARALDIEAKETWEDITITSVSFDSRQLEPGALFVPLIGEQDGHRYVRSALENGASAVLWQNDHSDIPNDIPALLVEDTLVALQALGRYYLQKINPKVVAVTGSNGKTTTKDMIAAILSTQFNVQKTFANFNNEIGVPMTILSMEPNTEILVVEMGMDRFGQIDELSRLAQPDVAVITMIGEAHIEFFGTRARIADAKMEIVNGLKEDGLLIYNGDEPLLVERANNIKQATFTFGSETTDDLQATNIVSDATKSSFRVALWPDENFTIKMIGAYNVKNALAALSVGKEFMIDVSQMAQALENFDLTKNRTEWRVGVKGFKILSDVYNSNPTAAKEVLTAFSDVKVSGKRIAVLGDMLELGENERQMHASLAEAIDPTKISEVYLCGPLMESLAEVLLAKFDSTQIHCYAPDEKEHLSEDLLTKLTSDDVVLLKASHGIHLEEVLKKIAKSE